MIEKSESGESRSRLSSDLQRTPPNSVLACPCQLYCWQSTLIGTCARDSELISSAHPLTIMVPFASLRYFCAPTLLKSIHRISLLRWLLPRPLSDTSSIIFYSSHLYPNPTLVFHHILKTQSRAPSVVAAAPALAFSRPAYGGALLGSLIPIWPAVALHPAGSRPVLSIDDTPAFLEHGRWNLAQP